MNPQIKEMRELTEKEKIELMELRQRCDILTSALDNLQESIVIYNAENYEIFRNRAAKNCKDQLMLLSTTHQIAQDCKMYVAHSKENELLGYTLDILPQLVWMSDVNGMNEYYNVRFCEVTGLDMSTFVGDGWKRIIHPDDLPSLCERWEESLRTGREYEAEYRIITRDGSYRWFIARASPIFNSRKEIIRWFGKFLYLWVNLSPI